jgi:hypothetical protein
MGLQLKKHIYLEEVIDWKAYINDQEKYNEEYNREYK